MFPAMMRAGVFKLHSRGRSNFRRQGYRPCGQEARRWRTAFLRRLPAIMARAPRHFEHRSAGREPEPIIGQFPVAEAERAKASRGGHADAARERAVLRIQEPAQPELAREILVTRIAVKDGRSDQRAVR